MLVAKEDNCPLCDGLMLNGHCAGCGLSELAALDEREPLAGEHEPAENGAVDQTRAPSRSSDAA